MLDPGFPFAIATRVCVNVCDLRIGSEIPWINIPQQDVSTGSGDSQTQTYFKPSAHDVERVSTSSEIKRNHGLNATINLGTGTSAGHDRRGRS